MNRSTPAFAALGIAILASPALAEPVSQSRDLPTFEKIKIKGGMDLTISVGGSQSVTIVADESDQDRIETSVQGDTLIIEMKGRFRSHRDLHAEISVAALNGLSINGSSDAGVTGVDSESFELEINGSGEVEIAGRCATGRFEINGSGDVAARAFECAEVAVDISGSGDAEVFASKSIEIDVNGSGDVDLWGSPRVKSVSISGSGDLESHS